LPGSSVEKLHRLINGSGRHGADVCSLGNEESDPPVAVLDKPLLPRGEGSGEVEIGTDCGLQRAPVDERQIVVRGDGLDAVAGLQREERMRDGSGAAIREELDHGLLAEPIGRDEEHALRCPRSDEIDLPVAGAVNRRTLCNRALESVF